MLVVKQGYAHKENGMNCQDAAKIVYPDHIKIVCDGCSEGQHSEVGANTFVELLSSKFMKHKDYSKSSIEPDQFMHITMDSMVSLFGTNTEVLKDYLSFTAFVVVDRKVYTCGDGYIITQIAGDIHFKKIDCGEYPKYLAYNYIDANHLKHYKDGVEIDKRDYGGFVDPFRIGVASDGIRFIVDRPDDDPLKQEFIEILKSDKDIKMKLFINRNEKIFQDDVSIAF